jgi:hypothetical protein
MADTILSRLSDDLSALAAGARSFVAEIRSKEGHRLTGVLWKPEAIVVSEQVLPDFPSYEVKSQAKPPMPSSPAAIPAPMSRC